MLQMPIPVEAPPAARIAPRGGAGSVITARGVTVQFGDRPPVLDGLDLDVRRGEILAFIGPSGTGKSVLMRTILGLNPMRSGTITVFGQDYLNGDPATKASVEMRMGVLFQQGALFSALTVRENIQVPMREYLRLPKRMMDDLTRLKIAMVGLAPDAIDKYPSELSGGMIKRAALARALALDPDLVFLDEPTAGLDPIGAAAFDELMIRLRDTLGLTVYMVTHDLDSIVTSADRVAVLGDRKVAAEGTVRDMMGNEQPWIRSYFRGKRGRNLIVT